MTNRGFSVWLSHHRLVRGSLSFLTVLCFTLGMLLPALLHPAAAQGVKADTNAAVGNQATIINNQNGPTQVDIVAPNGTGVSHNIYETYNVGQQGLILNNSATGGNSQLGGQINGNANLTTGNEAKLILNEVTGASRSQLLGTTEVFGKSADVILANPYGVTCNGCGFINTPRATLSTGRPVFEGEKFLGLDVTTNADGGLYLDENGKRADIRIEGAGADVTGLHYFDLVARAIYIGAEIRGSALTNDGKGTKIGLYAGLNRFIYDTRTATKLEDGDGSGGGIEIDSVVLGGAYANQITLLSTEKGVGINAPEVQSALGGIQLSADGKITIGKARAKEKIRVASKSSGINIKDYVFSETALELAAAGRIALDANAKAGSLGDVTIEDIAKDSGTVRTVTLDLADGALLGAGMDENGDLVGNGKLIIEAVSLMNKGTIASQTSIDIDAADFINEGTVSSQGDQTITVGGFKNQGTVSSQGEQTITGDNVTNEGTLSSQGTLDIEAGSFTNNGELSSKGKQTISADSVINKGTLSSQGTLDVATGSLGNSGEISSQGALKLTVSGTTDNSGSILSQSTLALLGGGVFENRSGAVFSGLSTVSLDINSGTNVGLVSSTGASVVFSVFEDLNNVGTISADSTASFDVAGTFDNSGDVTAKTGVNIANAQVNNSGSITSQGNVALVDVAGLVNTGALVSEAGDLSVKSSGDVTNTSTIRGAKSVSLDVAGTVLNDIEGTITTDGTLLIKAQTLDNLGDFPNGIIGGILSGRDVTLQVGTLNNSGEVLADNNIRIDAESSVFNTFGRIESGNRIDITAVDLIENLSGYIRGKNVKLKADVVINLDVVQRDDEILLPATVLADLEKSSDKLVAKALEAYQLQRKDLDVQEIDALRDRLINTAKEILKKTPGADINNRQAVLDRVSDGLVQDLANHANEAVKAKKAGASLFSRTGLEKKVKQEVKQLSVSDFRGKTEKKSSFWGLGASGGSSGNFEDTIVRKAEISASDNLTIQADSEVTAIGGKLSAGNNLDITSGGTINITAQQLEMRNNRKIKGGHENEYTLINEQAELTAGGNINLTATGDIELSGAKVKADKNVKVRSSEGEIRLSSVVNKRDYDYLKKKSSYMGFKKKKKVKKAYDEINVLTSITSGGEVLITSDLENVLVRGTEIEAQKNIHLKSGQKNVLLEAVADIHDYENYTSKSSFWGLNKKSKRDKGNSVTHQPTFVSAQGDVILDSAAGDLIINGSVVKAGRDIRVNAQNVRITAVHDQHYQQVTIKERGFFFDSFSGNGSAGVTFGYKNEKHVTTDTARLANVSGLLADGSIIMDVENDFTSEAAQLIAKNNLIVNAGGDITVLAAYDDISHSEKHKQFQIGITASVQENVSSAIETLKDVPKNWNAGAGSETNRLITRASTALKTIDTVSGLINGPLVSAGVSLGVSSSKSKANAYEHNAVAGVMEAGNDIILASAADITLTGTQATAGRNIVTDAANDLIIQSALSTSGETSSSRQIGASIGVSVGLGLQGVTVGGNVGANFNKANSDAEGTTHQHALIQAGKVTLKSGGDTVVKGALVAAREIDVDVAGNLNVESVQDTYRLRSKNLGFGLSFSMGLYNSGGWGGEKASNGQTTKAPTFNDAWNSTGKALTGLANGDKQTKTAGISFSYGKGKADVAWTNEISGLYAGDELTVNTTGNTHLKGAVLLTENSTPVINTGTFTFEDIQDYNKSSNFNISASYSFSFGGPELTKEQQAAQDKARLAKLGPVGRAVDGLPPFKVEGLYEKNVTEAVIRATVSKGTKLTVQYEQKQAELEESGKTKKFAAINTDVENIQEVTKDEREYVGFYASDTSVKAASAAILYIQDKIKQGLINADDGKKAEELIRRHDKGEVEADSLGPCKTEQQHGWLHNLIFTPAYAAKGDDCIILTKGRNGLYDKEERISPEAHKIARQAGVQGAVDGIKYNLKVISDLNAKRTLSSNELMMLASARSDLQYHMNRFEICWDSSFSDYFKFSSLENMISTAGYKVDQNYYKNAVDFAKGGTEFVERMNSFANLEDEKVKQLRNRNPHFYAALMDANNRGGIERVVDVAFQLNGLAIAGDIPQEQRQFTLDHVARQISTFNHIGANDFGRPDSARALVATQANALLFAVRGLPPGDQKYFINALREQYSFAKLEGRDAEYEYRKQMGRAAAEVIRRSPYAGHGVLVAQYLLQTNSAWEEKKYIALAAQIQKDADAYARRQGWCDGGECSQEALKKAQINVLDNLAQDNVIDRAAILRTLDAGIVGDGKIFAENASARARLASLANPIGKLDILGDAGSEKGFEYGRDIFTAPESERNNHAIHGWSVFENHDLYESLPQWRQNLDGKRSWTQEALKSASQDTQNLKNLTRTEYLDFAASIGFEQTRMRLGVKEIDKERWELRKSVAARANKSTSSILLPGDYTPEELKRDRELMNKRGAYESTSLKLHSHMSDVVQYGMRNGQLGALESLPHLGPRMRDASHPGIYFARQMRLSNFVSIGSLATAARFKGFTNIMGRSGRASQGISQKFLPPVSLVERTVVRVGTPAVKGKQVDLPKGYKEFKAGVGADVANGLPKNYRKVQAPDGTIEIVGPRGAIYKPTTRYDINGNVIYKNPQGHDVTLVNGVNYSPRVQSASINSQKLLNPSSNPGVAQSRINVAKVTLDNGKKKGWNYAIGRHGVNAQTGANKSKFNIADDQVKRMLQHPDVVKSNVYNVRHANGVIETNKFVRQVDVKKIVGIENTGQSTSVVTIITDRKGNLINMYPGSF